MLTVTIMLLAFLALSAILFLLGMVADRDAANRKNFTKAFIACVIAITLIIIVQVIK